METYRVQHLPVHRVFQGDDQFLIIGIEGHAAIFSDQVFGDQLEGFGIELELAHVHEGNAEFFGQTLLDLRFADQALFHQDLTDLFAAVVLLGGEGVHELLFGDQFFMDQDFAQSEVGRRFLVAECSLQLLGGDDRLRAQVFPQRLLAFFFLF